MTSTIQFQFFHVFHLPPCIVKAAYFLNKERHLATKISTPAIAQAWFKVLHHWHMQHIDILSFTICTKLFFKLFTVLGNIYIFSWRNFCPPAQNYFFFFICHTTVYFILMTYSWWLMISLTLLISFWWSLSLCTKDFLQHFT